MSSERKNIDLPVIGERLRKVRKALGMTLDKLGEISGLSTSGISDMEKGKTKPSSLYLHALSGEFNVNTNWILTGKGTMFQADIEFDLSFGEDNELVKELIHCLRKVNVARFEILRNFADFKRDHKDLIEEIKKEIK